MYSMEEKWRKIPGWEDYEISIDSKEGKCRRVFKTKIKEKANTYTKGGYIIWQLSKEGKVLSCQAARWIAITYPELVQNEYFEGAEIDHIDTDILNNHPSNLRWTTSSTNQSNPLTLKHMSDAQKGKNLNKPSLSQPIIQYDRYGEYIQEFPSYMEAERQTGTNHSGISMCIRGKRKYAGNGKDLYVWKKKEAV